MAGLARATRLFAGAAAAVAAMAVAPTDARAATSCDFGGGLLDVTLGASQDVAGLTVIGNQIAVFPASGVPLKCTGVDPTVTTTNTISVHNAPGLHFNEVAISGADQFGPGLTPEPGDDEIEIFVNLNGGQGTRLVVLSGLPSARMFFGTGGINPNAFDNEDQPDRDIDHNETVETIDAAGGPGPDLLSAQGGRGTGGPLTRDIVLFGNDGDDTLIGGDGSDALFGGEGLDAIAGFGGDDEIDAALGASASLTGGDGDDTIRPGSISDFVDAGLGDDLISFENIGDELATGVAADLDGTNAERLSGTEFADVLFGDEGPNTLLGLGGADQLDGRGGVDTLDAGAGADALVTRDGVVDTADCGADADTVTADVLGVDLLSGCESIVFPEPAGPGDPGGPGGGGGGPGQPSPPPAFGARTLVTLKLVKKRIRARGPVAVRVSNANGFPVGGRLAGATAKRIAQGQRKRRVKLAAKSFSVPARAAATVKLTLPKALRRHLASKGRVSLRLKATLRDPAGNARAVDKTLAPRLRK
jgi:hypothetical protein